jgi:hypothetical protein
MTQEALKLALETLMWCEPDCEENERGYELWCEVMPLLRSTLDDLPQRTWVGLDDDELTEAWHWGGCEPHIEGAHFKALYQYFEAKLKDKNHVAQKTD